MTVLFYFSNPKQGHGGERERVKIADFGGSCLLSRHGGMGKRKGSGGHHRRHAPSAAGGAGGAGGGGGGGGGEVSRSCRKISSELKTVPVTTTTISGAGGPSWETRAMGAGELGE